MLFVTEGREAEADAGGWPRISGPMVPTLMPSTRSASTCRRPSSRAAPQSSSQCPDHLRQVPCSRPRPHRALDETRRIEQKTTPGLKGLRWKLLRKLRKLSATPPARKSTDLLAKLTTKRTPPAWVYREQLREILDRKQINVVAAMLLAVVYQCHALQSRTP